MSNNIVDCNANTFKNNIFVYDTKKIDKRDILINAIKNVGQDDRSITLCDLGEIVKRYTYMKYIMPRVHPYYAVKCNNDLTILKTLALLGSGFDCASTNEIDIIRSLNVTLDKIIFANPTKPKQFIKHAAQTNVSLMTFDCEEELFKIKELYREARLVIRIRNNAKSVVYNLGKKFGCDPIEVPHILSTAKNLKLNVVGVCFHVGSMCNELESYARGISHCRKIFDIGSMLGFNMNLIDIGGGFYGLHSEMLQSYAKVINNSLEKYFPDTNSVTVISEPGRYLVESALWTACNIHTKKIIDQHLQKKHLANNEKAPLIRISNIDYCNENDKSKETHIKNESLRMYYINDGIFGLFNSVSYEGLKVLPEPLKERNNAELYQSLIWGPTCHSSDQILKEFLLPDLSLGEWLLFKQIGAYSLTMSTDFNNYPRSKIIHVLEKEYETVFCKEKYFPNTISLNVELYFK